VPLSAPRPWPCFLLLESTLRSVEEILLEEEVIPRSSSAWRG
jgi:hypothetical protein